MNIGTAQLGCTVSEALSSAQTRDESFLVQVMPGARITAVQGSGWMLNPRGDNQVDIHTNRPALPIAVRPGDSLVVARTFAAGENRAAYWDNPGRPSACAEMVAVNFVSYAPAPGLLRPPALGNDSLTRFLRGAPLPESLVNLSRLPSVVDVDALPVQWDQWGHGKPTIPYLTDLLRKFGGDCYDGWRTDDRTPDLQHPGYGTAYASIVSQTLVQLCSTASPAEKWPLALAVVQRAIDLFGAWSDGRVVGRSGGHGQGRKALIVAAGHLLGHDAIKILGDLGGYGRFSEDTQHVAGTWWFGGDWDARFQHNAEGDGDFQARPPATWTRPVTGDGNKSERFRLSYYEQCCQAQVGTALAMRLMGTVRQMGTAFDRAIRQWMEGPPVAAKAELVAAGINLPFGTDIAWVKGNGFCRAAYLRYYR